ncbi:MAG: tetratricopeptide repeat protein [Candidatus Eisenbacteria bacterium]|nr:tetratricopeptide repeat protein [Candidatus Eisenbacteria bacterium]
MKAIVEIGSAGAPDARAPEFTQRFSLRDAARILEVPEARLRALARAGFLAPQRGPIGPLSFGFQDLLLLRTTKGLLESGVSMRRIRRIWASLREQLAAEMPLTSISISTDGEEVVASDGETRWGADSGQFLLNFEASEIAERAGEATGFPRLGVVVGGARAPDAAGERTRAWTDAAARGSADDLAPSAAEWYEAGCELEATSPDEARDAYAHAIALDPTLAQGHVNLGRLLHIAGERGRAEPHYREAVRLDPDDPTPHFNLGVMLEELGRRDEAVHAYRQAILRDPDFADAHCNLGLLLESFGRPQEAVRHLMAARKLGGAPE